MEYSSVPFAAAEEAAVTTPDDVPGIYFGADPDTAFLYFTTHWNGGCSFSNEATEENITVGDGMPFMVLTYAAVPSEQEYKMPMTAKLYYRKGTLFAAAMVIDFPKDANLEEAKKSLTQYLKASVQDTLKLEEIGICAELLGETAHLQEGQEIWRYTLTAGETKTKAIMTMKAEDGKLYFAVFPAEKDEELMEKTTIEVSLTDLAGFAELDAEKKEAVRLYVQFVMQQQKKLFEEYIAYVKDQK